MLLLYSGGVRIKSSGSSIGIDVDARPCTLAAEINNFNNAAFSRETSYIYIYICTAMHSLFNASNSVPLSTIRSCVKQLRHVLVVACLFCWQPHPMFALEEYDWLHGRRSTLRARVIEHARVWCVTGKIFARLP